MVTAPSSGAEKSANAPCSAPIAVRAAPDDDDGVVADLDLGPSTFLRPFQTSPTSSRPISQRRISDVPAPIS